MGETRGLPHVLDSPCAGQGRQGASLGVDRVIGRLPGCGRGWELLEVEPPRQLHSCPSRSWGGWDSSGGRQVPRDLGSACRESLLSVVSLRMCV